MPTLDPSTTPPDTSGTYSRPAGPLTLRGATWAALDRFRAHERTRYDMERVAVLPTWAGARAWGLDTPSVAVATDGKTLLLVPVDAHAPERSYLPDGTPAPLSGVSYDAPKVGSSKRARVADATAGPLPLGNFPPVDGEGVLYGPSAYLPGVAAHVEAWRALFAGAETNENLSTRLYLPDGSPSPADAGARVKARSVPGDAAGVVTVATLRDGPGDDVSDPIGPIGLDATYVRRALSAATDLAYAASRGMASGASVVVRCAATSRQTRPVVCELRSEDGETLLGLAVVMPLALGEQ